jgi:hypothetical protein
MKRMIMIFANSSVEHVVTKDTFEPDLKALYHRGVIRIVFKYEHTDCNGGHKSVELADIDLELTYATTD